MRRRIHPYSSAKRRTPHVVCKGLTVVYILLYGIRKVMLTIYRQILYCLRENLLTNSSFGNIPFSNLYMLFDRIKPLDTALIGVICRQGC